MTKTQTIDTLDRKIRYNGELYGALCSAFLPAYTSRQGILDVQRLASDAGISAVTAYHAIRTCKMTAATARKLIELHGRTKTDENGQTLDPVALAPFVI